MGVAIKWPRDAVIEAVRALGGPDGRVSYSDIVKDGKALLRAIERHNMSPRCAVEEAGLEYYKRTPGYKPKEDPIEKPVEILSVPEEYRRKYSSTKRPKCGWF